MKKITSVLYILTALVCGVFLGIGISSIPDKSFEKLYTSSIQSADISVTPTSSVDESGSVEQNDTESAIKVNINTADKTELMILPGIGETKAEAIIKYRGDNGFFISIEEIKNVSGIGDGLFEKIKDIICV